LNRTVQGLYPPGSTFKVPVAGLALRENLARPDREFDYRETDDWYWVGERLCHQRYIGGGLIVSCNSYLEQMTLTEGLAWSDNLVFADLAGELGAEKMWEGGEDFGFGQVLEFDLPVLTSSLAQSADNLNDPAQLAMTGFGQSEVLATPLQMALVAASIANDGKMPQPYLIDQVLRPDGSVLRQTRPDTWLRPLGRGDARRTAEMMVATVEDGWASPAGVPGFTVGGKTGTAEWSGTARGLSPHSWFIGFIEMSDGQKVALAIIAEQGGQGGDLAAPMAGRIFAEMSR
jgi:peptidoglycan glycosyltransferase